MKLVYSNDKTREVKIGDKVIVGKEGTQGEITRIELPRSPASTGRVYVKTGSAWTASWFPGVIGAEWVNREDQS